VVSTGRVARQPEVVLMCGLAGSGKTTFAKQLERQGYVRLSIDEELWHSFGRYGIDYPAERYGALSKIVERRLRERLVTYIGGGADVVVDFSFWKKQDREAYKALVDALGGRWRLVYLDVPSSELRRRLQLRSGRFDANAAFPIDEPVFERYQAMFEEPLGEGEEVIAWESEETP
jgi:predicted kinase